MLSKLKDYLTGKRKIPTLLLIAIFSVVVSVLPIYRILAGGLPLIKKLPTLSHDLVEEIYPSELEIIIKDGKASINQTEPYFITIKVSRLREITESFSENASKNLPKISSIRLLTIDTNASVEDYDRYQTLFLLTRENLVYVSDGEIKFQSIASISDMTVTKGWLTEKVSIFLGNSFISFLLNYGIFLLVPLVPIFAALVFTLTIASFAFFIYLMARIMQTGISYKRVFVWLTLVNYPIMLLIAFADEFGLAFAFFAQIVNNLSTLVILALAYIILRSLQNQKGAAL